MPDSILPEKTPHPRVSMKGIDGLIREEMKKKTAVEMIVMFRIGESWRA